MLVNRDCVSSSHTYLFFSKNFINVVAWGHDAQVQIFFLFGAKKFQENSRY